MTKMIIGMCVVLGIAGVICTMCPSTKYAIKGNISKIENAVQLNNAIEIFDAKNMEMQEKYIKLVSGIKSVDMQIAQMQKRADAVKAKPESELNAAKYVMFTNGVAKLDAAKAKMLCVKESMKSNIISHRSKIELLRAKLVYLESLKTTNSYLKDMNIDGDFGEGVNAVVEQAIAAEEAVTESLNDMAELKAEMVDL